MILEIQVGEKRIPLELNPASNSAKVSVGGREVACDWVRLSDKRYSLILDGRVFDLNVVIERDTFAVSGREGTLELRITDPKHLRAEPVIKEGRLGLQRIIAEMPGKVVRVLVQVGDPVVFDQGLLVLEAMKMQNEIRSPKTGIIREIGAREGQAVNSGDFLLSVE